MTNTRVALAPSACHGCASGGGTMPAHQGFSLAQVHAALRELPSDGWVSRWTGRRDRALLVLSEMAGLSYDTIVELTVADIGIANRVATISTPGGTTTLHTDDDVLLCGPCALARWIHAIDLATVDPSGRIAAAVIARAAPLTDRSPHLCECTVIVADAALQAPILPVTDAWGPRLPSRRESAAELMANEDDRANVIAFPMRRSAAAAAAPAASPARSTAACATGATDAIPTHPTADRLSDDPSTAAVALRLSNYFRTDLDSSASAASGTAASLEGRTRQLLEDSRDDHLMPVPSAR